MFLIYNVTFWEYYSRGLDPAVMIGAKYIPVV